MKKFNAKKSVLAVALVATFASQNASAWEWWANDADHKTVAGALLLSAATTGLSGGAFSILFGVYALGKGMEIVGKGTPEEQEVHRKRVNSGLVLCSSRVWHESNTGQLQSGQYSHFTTDYDQPMASELSPITPTFTVAETKRYLKKSFSDKCNKANVGYTTDNFHKELNASPDSEYALGLSCTAVGERGNALEIYDLAESDVVAGASYHFLKNGYIVKNRNGTGENCVDVWADDWAVADFLKKEKESNKMD